MMMCSRSECARPRASAALASTVVTRLPFDSYLDHIRTESRRFRDVLAVCEPAARVPSCPDWDAADLLWHLSTVQRFWERVVRERPAGPGEDWQEPQRPGSYADLLAAFDASHAAFVAALEPADPTETAWSWSTEQTVGFTYRRQAQECLVHRLDAELTAGSVTELDPLLAADGGGEGPDVMFGGAPARGRVHPPPPPGPVGPPPPHPPGGGPARPLPGPP